MAEGQDWRDQQFQNGQYSVWDPTLGRSVEAPSGAASYVNTHAPNYSGYSGTVAGGWDGTRVGADAFGVNTGTRNSPGGQLRTDYERTSLNPYDQGAKDTFQQGLNRLWPNIHVQRGVRPNFGYAPGYGTIDVNAGLRPTAWDQIDQNRRGWQSITPEEEQRLQSAGGNPTMQQLMQQKGQTGLPDFGRGFDYKGNGQYSPHQLSSMQKIARQYYWPALMSIGGLAAGGTTGIPAMLAGAGWGAFTSGVGDKFQHPWATGLGAAGGLAGGYGAGQLSGALQAGPVAAGAIGGIGSTVGRTAGETLGGRPWNTSNFIRDIALSGGAGAVGGAITGRGSVSPEGKPIPPTAGEKVLGNLGSNAARTIGGLVWPAQAPSRPQAPQETEAQRRKRLALSQQQMNPYK